jgi:hypothetical protein
MERRPFVTGKVLLVDATVTVAVVPAGSVAAPVTLFAAATTLSPI